MKTEEIEQDIIHYLSSQLTNQAITNPVVESNTRYLDEEIIDSLGLILLIEHLEDKYSIRFSAKDMQSYEFQTVKGLASIVSQLKGT